MTAWHITWLVRLLSVNADINVTSRLFDVVLVLRIISDRDSGPRACFTAGGGGAIARVRT